MNDATLLSYFSWDSGSFTDNSPNQIQAWMSGSPSIGPGYKNKGLLLNGADSYLTAYAYAILAFPNQPFSTSIWIRPTKWGGTIIHSSTKQAGDGICCHVLGLTARGFPSTMIFTTDATITFVTANTTSLPFNQWSHVVQTFSPENGRKYLTMGHLRHGQELSAFFWLSCFIVRLFVNGTLRGQGMAATSYGAPGRLYLIVGSHGLNGDRCQRGDINPGQFFGSLDEYRVFNRDLSEQEICALATQTVSHTSDSST